MKHGALHWPKIQLLPGLILVAAALWVNGAMTGPGDQMPP
jgi:hypothetical protein